MKMIYFPDGTMNTIYFPDETMKTGLFAATIGFFDGVHLGHRYLLGRLKDEAENRGLKSMAVTFACHPRQVVQSDWRPALLTTLEEKIRLIGETGVDVLVVLRFDLQMAALSSRDFMQRVLFESLGVRCLLTGYDNRFGHDRSEGFEDYRRYGWEIGMDVVCNDALSVGEANVSSSRIRHLLHDGSVEEAARCLGRPYALSGHVVHGEQIGRTLGFPTANLQLDEVCQLVPADGVYAVMVSLEGEASKRGIMNIGTRPTFNGETRTLETNILDEMGDIYGKTMSVAFVGRIRDERHFPSGEALAEQIRKDKAEAERLFCYFGKSEK